MGNECNPVCGPMHFANNEQQISNNVRPIGVENQSDTSTDQSVTNNQDTMISNEARKDGKGRIRVISLEITENKKFEDQPVSDKQPQTPGQEIQVEKATGGITGSVNPVLNQELRISDLRPIGKTR